MKLIKCHVTAFGKLKDFSYDFSSGLNTVKQDNGWGKSTFATFIKAMFYGLNDSKRSVAENERVKFRPWNSTEKFGGFVEFEWGGKQFKLERFFGLKESEDTVRLFDVQTGKEFSNTQNLGKRIFEIDEEGFLSTTYFSQKDFEIKSNTSLTAKFNAVCEVQDTDLFDKALSSVDEKIKSYKYRGDKGLIPDAKRAIFAIDEQIRRAENSVATLKNLKDEADVLQNEINGLQQKSKQLTDQLTIAGKAEAVAVKKQAYDKLTLQKKKLIEDKETAEQVIRDNFSLKNQTSDIERKISTLIGVNAQRDAVKEELAKYSENKPFENKKTFTAIDYTVWGVTAISLIAFIVAVILGGFNLPSILFLSAFVLGVIATVARIFSVKFNKKNANAQYVDIINQKNADLERLNNQALAIEREIDEFISKFDLGEKFDRQTSLRYISKIFDVYSDIEARILEADRELDLMKNDVKDFENYNGEQGDVNLIEQQLKQTDAKFEKLTKEIADKKSSIRIYEDIASSFAELESKKAELIDKVDQYEKEKEVFELTSKFLKQADENLKVRYKAPLQNSLKKYFNLVVSGDKDVNIDVDLKVTVNEESGQKSVDYYSKGYQNLFEICKRFALTDVLFTGEKPFIILDDPFYNLDDQKLVSAINLIKKLSNEYQILYLVCHDSRRA
ncbi:MAG: hypothetical protein E7347_06890 [Clostridiales bacterium]|nr:hypothetical protein [Clostridiales bacterium]